MSGPDYDLEAKEANRFKVNKQIVSPEQYINEVKGVKEEWGIIDESYALRPIKDRILVIVDPFKSRMDCTQCGGVGHTNVVCKSCLGKRKHRVHGFSYETDCLACTPKRADGSVAEAPFNTPTGFTLCSLCGGRQGTIVLPDDAKVATTTGKVVAMGRLVTEYKIGTTVMFTNYTGTKFQYNNQEFRMMTETDVLCEVKRLKTNVDILKDTGYSELENVGDAVNK